VRDQAAIGGESSVRAHLLQRLLRRPEVADAVVEHGDQRPRAVAHVDSVPFVDGTPEPSTRTASRRVRASPLNVASITWCVLTPARRTTWSVIAAEVANDAMKCSAISGLKGGLPSGSTSPKGTSYATYGRPDRSSETWISASSRG